MGNFSDRLLSYSDALAAVSFVSVSGLGIAAADPETRCSLVLAAVPIAVSNLIFSITATAIMLKLRRWENELRSESELSERALEIARYLHLARLVIVWVSALLSTFLLYAITRDQSC